MTGNRPSDESPRQAAPAGLLGFLVFVAALAILLFLLRFDRDRRSLPERVEVGEVVAFEDRVTRALPPVDLRPAQRLRFRATEVTWLDAAGEAWVSSPRVAFSLQVGVLLAGDPIIVEDGVVERPRIRLVQSPAGHWNFQLPLGPAVAAERPGAPGLDREVRLRNIRVVDGDVTVRMPDQTMRATALQVTLASGLLAGPGVDAPSIHVSTATANLILPDPRGGTMSRAVAATDARLRFPDGAVGFDVARVAFGTSVAAGLIGVWDPGLGALGLDAEATVERLHLADLPWVQVEAPEDAVASGRVVVRPVNAVRSLIALEGLDLKSETSAATGSLRLVYGPGGLALEAVDLRLDPLALSLVEAFTDPLPYVGTIRGTVRGVAADIAFDLEARLATAPAAPFFTVGLTGRLALVDLEPHLRLLVARLEAVPLAALEPLAPGLPLAGQVSGTIRVEGPPGEVPLLLDVRLEAGGGVVTVAGTLDLTGAEPAYAVQGRLVGVEVGRLVEPAVPPVELHAAFRLTGRGVGLPTATVNLGLEGSFTGWEASPGDTVSIQVEVVRGLLMAERVRLALGPVDLTAAGNWRFANGVGGAIQYTLRVARLEPLAPYLPAGPDGRLPARGALAASGTVSGSLDAPLLAGTVRGTGLVYGEWSVSWLEATYDVRLGPGLPHVMARAAATDLRTPGGDLASASVVLDFVPPNLQLALRGDRPADDGVVLVEADGLVNELNDWELFVRRVELDLAGQRWEMPEPAFVALAPGDSLTIRGLRLERVDAEGLVRVDGVLVPDAVTDLAVEVAALPVGDLLGLIGLDLRVDGELWAAGSIQGTAGSPLVDLDVRLEDGVLQDVPVRLLRARVLYAGQTLTFTGDGWLEEEAAFEVEGSLPLVLTLGLPPTAELAEDGPIRARLVAARFPLGALQPGLPMVRDLAGWLTADLVLEGTVADPVVRGGATLREGAVTVALLDQRYQQIEGEVVLEGQELRLERLVAWSDGYAALSGLITLADLANPVLDLTAELQSFRPQAVSGRRDAAATGQLRVQGPMLEPVLSGNLLFDDGTLDLARLQPTPPLGDGLIGVAERLAPLGPMDLDLLEPSPTAIRISQLDLRAGPDLWFQTDEVRIQLSGDLTIMRPGEDVMITGILTADRGTFNLRIGPATRRFDIEEATIQFFGTPGPDPALDVTASRLIPGPNRLDFNLQVHLTGTLSNPAVSFATNGTTIPEPEALNFLIFGRATATLADFPGAGFGTTQSIYDALAFYGAFDWLSASVAEQFGAGIDYFQIQILPGTVETGPEVYFVLGHEVFQDVFATVTLPTAEFAARWSLTAEWRIDRQWTLEFAYEPPDLAIRSTGRRLPFAVERDQQLFLSIRRRWTY
jgi:hypothetical protein